MPILLNDEASVAKLAAASGPEDVCAPDGRVLGRFIPAEEKMSFPELGITDRELEAWKNDPNAKWYTPEEVMARLRELR